MCYGGIECWAMKLVWKLWVLGQGSLKDFEGRFCTLFKHLRLQKKAVLQKVTILTYMLVFLQNHSSNLNRICSQKLPFMPSNVPPRAHSAPSWPLGLSLWASPYRLSRMQSAPQGGNLSHTKMLWQVAFCQLASTHQALSLSPFLHVICSSILSLELNAALQQSCAF